MQLSLNDFLTPTERLPELIDHRKPKGLKSDRWALAKPLLQSAPVVTENPAEFERVIESVLDTLALNQKQAHERLIGHEVTWVTGATLPKPKHHKGKILAVLAPGTKRENWIHILPPEFDEMGKLVKGMEDARQTGKERSKELKALRAEWKRLYKSVKVNAKNGGYLVAEETEEGIIYRCIAPHLVHKQAESQTLLLQEGLAETAPVIQPEPVQIDSPVAVSIIEFEAQNPDFHCSFSKMQNDGSVKVEYEGFGQSSGKKAEVIIPAVDNTPVSSPSVTAPEPAAKVVLGIPLGHSHPGLGINKPVCFYCKGQSELEYAGLFPNAIKSMNHHIWRCKKQPRHQLVCAEKGDWWYQWCGGVGYGVTYGVPELWMWKDVFQAATGQEPELTPEPEIDECSELCQTIPCETCSELSLSVFDISSQKLTNRTVLLKSTELNELISETQKTSVCEISEELKKRGLYAPDFLIQAILGGEPNTQALEAAELRAKIAEVHEIRLRQKKVEELKRQREQIGKKISEVMGRGFSRINDEEAAHFQKKYDRASEAIRALEEQIPTIIPATWRWEERLAEIEKELGKGEQS